MRKVNTQGQGEKVDTRDKSRDVTEGTQREQGGAGETEGAAEKHGEMVCSAQDRRMKASARAISRRSLSTQAAERMVRVKAAAEAEGMTLG